MIRLIEQEKKLPDTAGPRAGFYSYSSSWHELYRQVFSYRLARYSLVRDNEEVGSFCYAEVRSSLFSDRLISMPFADQGGFMLNPGAELSAHESAQAYDSLVGVLDKEAGSKGFAYAEIRGHDPVISACRKKGGFVELSPYVSFVVDTSAGYAKVRDGYNSNILKNLRKADKFVSVSECCDTKDLERIYGIYVLQMRSFGSLPLPQDYFSHLSACGAYRIFCARVKNRIVAFLGMIFHGNKAYADINAGLDKYESFFPKVKLFDETLRLCCQNGIGSYDFMRTRSGSGVYAHKMKWGGVQIPVTYYFRSYKKRANFAMDPRQKRYLPAQTAVRCMPLLLISKFGPGIRAQIGK